MLIHENFADGIITLNLARDPTIRESEILNTEQSDKPEEPVERLDIDDETFIKYSLTKNNITDYGLAFFFEVIKDLVISKEFIEVLYRVIIKIARTKFRPILPVPDMPIADEAGVEPTEEEKAAVQKSIDEITKSNSENEKINEDIAKIQAKVKIAYR